MDFLEELSKKVPDGFVADTRNLMGERFSKFHGFMLGALPNWIPALIITSYEQQLTAEETVDRILWTIYNG